MIDPCKIYACLEPVLSYLPPEVVGALRKGEAKIEKWYIDWDSYMGWDAPIIVVIRWKDGRVEEYIAGWTPI